MEYPLIAPILQSAFHIAITMDSDAFDAVCRFLPGATSLGTCEMCLPRRFFGRVSCECEEQSSSFQLLYEGQHAFHFTILVRTLSRPSLETEPRSLQPTMTDHASASARLFQLCHSQHTSCH